MRMLMKVQMPTESGNDAIKDGSLPQIMGSSIEALLATLLSGACQQLLFHRRGRVLGACHR